MERQCSGNKGGPILVFLHGWPDSAELWTKQLPAFEQDYYCVRLTLPNYGTSADRQPFFDFDELGNQLAQAIKESRAEVGNQRAYLIAHDWGAVIAYHGAAPHPGLIDGLVTMDVGAEFKLQTITAAVSVLTYQWWLILSFFVGHVWSAAGDWMARSCAKIIKAPAWQSCRWRMSFPYAHYWRRVFTFQPLKQQIPSNLPFMFLYGERKPFHFHTQRWLNEIQSRPNGSANGLATDHWLMWHEPERTNELLKSWLKEQESAQGPAGSPASSPS